MSTTRKLIWLFCVLVTVSLLSSVAVRNTHSKIRALVLRAQIVLFIESILSLGSIYIWRNISQLYPLVVGSGLVDEVVASETQLTTDRSRCGKARPCYIRGRFQSLWKLFLFTILFSAQLCYPLGVTYVSVEPYTIVLFCYICLGIHILLMTNITLYHVIGYVFQKIFCPKTPVNALANFMKVVVIVIVSGFLAFSAVSQAFYGPILKQVDVPINNLPKSFDGTRIVQVSDIHLGPTVGRSQLERAIHLINSLNPDLVSITGDLVDSPVEYLSEAALPLTQISSRYGTYFVTGNHEYYTGDVDAWINYLKTLGVRCLHNENIQIHHPNKYDYFFLAGTDDVQGERFRYGDHGFKLEEALDGTDQQHPIILLAHRPAAAYTALSADRGVNLVLSGHTHGGQFFPMVIGAYLANPYFSGLYQYSPSSYVYVSSGTFYWGIPMRLFSTPEVTLLTLHAA